MKKTGVLMAVVSICLLHIHYFGWLLAAWGRQLSILYPCVVISVSLFFFYIRSKGLGHAENARTPFQRADIKIIFLLTVGIGLWAVSCLYTTRPFLAGISLPILLHTAWYIFYGKEVSRRYVFPTYLLLLVNPAHLLLEKAVAPVLKKLLAVSVCFMANAIGITTVKNGLLLSSTHYSVLIVDECSGLRGIAASLLFGAVLSYTILRRPVPRALVFLSMLPLVFFTNILRLVILLYTGEVIGQEAALEFFHGIGGIAVYLIIYPVLFLEAICLKRLMESKRG